MSTRHPVILTLNGETVKMLNLKVEAVLPFKDKDQSGQTSGTQKSEGGIKAKELNVTGTVPFRNVEFLTRIFELAEGVDGGGAQTVYRVSNFTAAAINMRQATFTGRVSAPESDSLRAWSVSFTLREYSSVPEKKSQIFFPNYQVSRNRQRQVLQRRAQAHQVAMVRRQIPKCLRLINSGKKLMTGWPRHRQKTKAARAHLADRRVLHQGQQ